MRSVNRRVQLVPIFVVMVTLWGLQGAAEQRVIELTVRGGTLPEDQRVIRVQQGDEVTLRWTTDKPLTIHLHGYDIEKKLSPNAPTTMQFSARATGRFPIEVHGPRKGEETTLGYLEVYPR